MKILPGSALACALVLFVSGGSSAPAADGANPGALLFGYRNADAELSAESRFLAVPDPKRAQECCKASEGVAADGVFPAQRAFRRWSRRRAATRGDG